ncbi:hypothetical protein SBOR_7752 [Sclerotinia borealis F-4128]|uniref:Uncharacterized protein n=1 Tax=Sclerotinia borealis (strain F-4128) TaxID=1432307 RepID=W9C7N6_SCLBF|nr:hypothetical protein SBOR_7752 [Sclerotinia borealis F-4128]
MASLEREGLQRTGSEEELLERLSHVVEISEENHIFPQDNQFLPLTNDSEPSPSYHEVKPPAPTKLYIPPTYFPSELSIDSAKLFAPSTQRLSARISECVSPKELDPTQETVTEFPDASDDNTAHDVFTDPRPVTPLGVLNAPFPYPGEDYGLPDPLFKPGVYLGTLIQPDRKPGDRNVVYATISKNAVSRSWISPIVLTAHKTNKFGGHCKLNRHPRVKFEEIEFRDDLKDKCQTYEAMRELVERRISGWYETYEVRYARTS